jgi:flavin reductase
MHMQYVHTIATRATHGHHPPAAGVKFVSGSARIPNPQGVSTDRFIEAMSGAAAGVNIVTTSGAAGRFGLTVSAFSPVSAEPPMVLVCINRNSPACTAISDNQRFCVNLLNSKQRALADIFAGRPDRGNPYDFGAAKWRKAPGASPILRDAIASFDCRLDKALNAGTHRIFIGRVVTVEVRKGRALIYNNRRYGTPRTETEI